MNILNGVIETIKSEGKLSVAGIRVGDVLFSSIIIETPETVNYLEKGKSIKMLFKETEVVIGRGGNIDICIQNRLPGSIQFMEYGVLLSKLVLDTAAGKIRAIILADSIKSMELQVGDQITVMVKSSEIMLSE